MRKPLSHAVSKYGRSTPQSQPAPGKAQVKNSAGGYVFKLDKWGQFRRFLILGTEGGTYYASERKATLDNSEVVLECVAEDGARAVKETIEVSQGGLAHKNSPALYVMAFAISYGNLSTRKQVAQNIHLVARTGTHLFEFVDMATKMRGWGVVLKRAVANWYRRQTPDNVAYQVTKYAQREGWSHLDTMRLSRPLDLRVPENKEIYDFVNGKEVTEFTDSKSGVYLEAVAEAKSIDVTKQAGVRNLCTLIEEHNLPREVLPTAALNHPLVWQTMLPRMPLTAMIRNLGKMSEIGLFKQAKSSEVDSVVNKLSDGLAIQKARVHPMTILFALKTYASGMGLRSGKTWPVNRKVVDALDSAFYLAFKNVEPTGKRFMLALDISGSMGWGAISGTSLTPREAAAALALVTLSVEDNTLIKGFSTKFIDLAISPRQRLDDVVKYTSHLSFGGTDCSLPMVHAQEQKLEIDAFVILTDNETWAGRSHPHQALISYRRAMGIDAKLISVGMTSTGFTIADPNDDGSLDVVGFSADTPSVISTFVKGF